MGERDANAAGRTATLVDSERAAMVAVRLTIQGCAIRVARNMGGGGKKEADAGWGSRRGADVGLLTRAQPCGPIGGHQRFFVEMGDRCAELHELFLR